MKFKDNLPITPGWYWVKYNSTRDDGWQDEAWAGWQVVEVRDYAGELAIGNTVLKGWERAEMAEWSGPLDPPK